jgi:hypothetical protein
MDWWGWLFWAVTLVAFWAAVIWGIWYRFTGGSRNSAPPFGIASASPDPRRAAGAR